MRYVQTSDETFVRHIHNEVENIQWNATTKTTVRKLSQAQREELGISPLKMVTSPYFDIDTHIREEGDAVLTDGVWTQNWIITAAPEDIKAVNIRQTRDAKLATSDWRALSDNTMPSEWTTYRQALRDVPAQAGFPNSITWPESP
tara:strand:+ start:491 stop:925 length:435 start_codon:yes stop_codon:yes gene_type:complete